MFKIFIKLYICDEVPLLRVMTYCILLFLINEKILKHCVTLVISLDLILVKIIPRIQVQR